MITMKLTRKIIKLGKGQGVVLPAPFLKQFNLKVGDKVDVTVYRASEGVQLSIRPIDRKEDQLVIDTAKQILKRYHQDFQDLADR